MKVIEIAFTCYPVTDLIRARQFYEETLGLKESRRFEEENMIWIEYDIGPGTLCITNEQEWKPSPHGGAAALEVEDFNEAIKYLKDNSVTFLYEPMQAPMCSTAIISDPDGNSIGIHKRKVVD